ncbi:MAG: hypothetical protein M3081_06550 [Gemmatimonadota bacterium]|nr:hypothetical protein [Gemmatimonadota bacterium]
MKHLRIFKAVDGVRWGVEITRPSANGCQVIFRYPSSATGRLDRYAWCTVQSPDAKNVTARLDEQSILDSLDDGKLALLFRRSAAISAADTPLNMPVPG